jgi:hypothetical protein
MTPFMATFLAILISAIPVLAFRGKTLVGALSRAAAACVLGLATGAGGESGKLFADIVHLKNGKKVEGEVAPGAKPGTVEIRTGEGTSVTIPDGDVLKIEKLPSPLEDFERKRQALPAGDLDALDDLLLWTRERRLGTKAKAVSRKILEIDPNHEEARKELGYVLFENRWVPEGELRKRNGLVRFQGEWMTSAEKARREAESSRREMEELFALVENENPRIQEYALKKLLSFRGDSAREVFGKHVLDTRDAVRWVAVRALADFPVRNEDDDAARGIARSLHRAALGEQNDRGWLVYLYTLRRFYPAESRRLAEESTRGATDERQKQRAEEILNRLRG